MKLAFLLVIALGGSLWAQSPAGTGPTASVPASSISYTPKWIVSAGGGLLVPGSGKFAFWSASTYLGQQTYATAATEYTLTKGQVQNCALAGVSKVMYQFGSLSAGVTGLGGGCTSSSGSSAGAGSGQGFLSWHIGKSAWSIVLTGTKTVTAAGSSAFKLTLSPARASQ